MEIISPLQLYLILQLDSFNRFLFTVFMIMILGAIIKGIMAACATQSYGILEEEKDAQVKSHMKGVYGFGIGAILTLLLGALLPSTKVMAAILVVPAIVNNETVQQEAGELYTMAKQAMAEALETEEVVPEEGPTTEEEEQ